jgi:mRNA interferase MazF
MSVVPLRGQIYRVDLGYGLKPWLVLSNNQRNRKLSSLLAARITTTDKHASLPTLVPLQQDDPLVGYVNTDDLQQLFRDELGQLLGSLAPVTLMRVNEALRIALGLP